MSEEFLDMFERYIMIVLVVIILSLALMGLIDNSESFLRLF